MNDAGDPLHRFLDMSPEGVRRRRMRVIMRKRRAMKTTTVKKQATKKRMLRRTPKAASDATDVYHAVARKDDTAVASETVVSQKICSPMQDSNAWLITLKTLIC